ncbi:BTB domain-containing protein [Trichonephila clavipes]|nr:BTB domain-containing protein [Trichonephila clavipes]
MRFCDGVGCNIFGLEPLVLERDDRWRPLSKHSHRSSSLSASDSLSGRTSYSSENSLSPVQSPKGAYAGAVEDEAQHMTIKAHCIVIASRCDWFRKALLSGMKESINKKIVIHDTTPHLFLIFLEYLYGGQVDTGQLSTEQLADLMQLSDRYEVDCLKQISEDALKNLIDDDSALFLLGIADQFNARALRLLHSNLSPFWNIGRMDLSSHSMGFPQSKYWRSQHACL